MLIKFSMKLKVNDHLVDIIWKNINEQCTMWKIYWNWIKFLRYPRKLYCNNHVDLRSNWLVQFLYVQLNNCFDFISCWKPKNMLWINSFFPFLLVFLLLFLFIFSPPPWWIVYHVVCGPTFLFIMEPLIVFPLLLHPFWCVAILPSSRKLLPSHVKLMNLPFCALNPFPLHWGPSTPTPPILNSHDGIFHGLWQV